MLLTSPLSSPLKNPVRDVFSPAGSSQSLTAQVQALFAGGKVGGMWDMGDTATLFQDYATPVTAVTQPIGIVLDKSQGLVLGSELVTNGDFSGGTTGWVPRAGAATHAVVGGEMEVTAINTSAQVTEQSFSVVSGRTYKVTGTMRAAGTNSVANSARISIHGATVFSLAQVAANGVQTPFSLFATANSSTFQVQLSVASLGAWGAISDKAYFDNISVREIPGNHATQPTAGARPLYQVDGGYGCAQFDAVNDFLSFPAINFSATDKATLVASVTLTGSGNHGLLQFGTETAGGFNAGYYIGTSSWRASLHGSSGNAQTRIDPAFLPSIPHTRVLTFDYDLTGATALDEAKIRLNGAAITNTVIVAGPAGTGNLQNGSGTIGQSQGTFCFAGYINRYALIGGAITVGERAILEAWAAEGAGITL